MYEIDQRFLQLYHNHNHILPQLGINKPVEQPCTYAVNRALPVYQGFLFYNGLHPTTVVHHYLAKKLQSYILRYEQSKMLILDARYKHKHINKR